MTHHPTDEDLWRKALALLEESDRIASLVPADEPRVAGAIRGGAARVVANIAAAQRRSMPPELARRLERMLVGGHPAGGDEAARALVFGDRYRPWRRSPRGGVC